METVQTLGFAHFLAQTDVVGKSVLALLIVMSVLSWYLIFTKSLQMFGMRGRVARFLQTFWAASSVKSVAAHLEQHSPNEPFSHLAWQAINAQRHYASHGAHHSVSQSDDGGAAGEFLTRSMRRVIDEETARLESGLTALASVGATAPFVGLFGTVWGVYHALLAIGLSGQGTLDKVAGPVGEALIMTALGLAVAIPAVLGYNAMVRANRLLLARLDAFAHDLYAVLITGLHLGARIDDAVPHTPAQPAENGAR